MYTTQPAKSETRVPIVNADASDGRAANGAATDQDTGETGPAPGAGAGRGTGAPVEETVATTKAMAPVHATPTKDKDAKLKKKKFYNSSELPFIDEYFPAPRDEYSV